MAGHRASSSGCHLDLAMVQLKKQGEETIVQLKEQLQKHVEEMMQLKEQHVQEIVTQLHHQQLEEVKQLKGKYQEQEEKVEKLWYMMKKINLDLKPSKEHVVLKMSSFEQHRVNNMAWYSPGFYTHPHGYKMCLKVYSEREGTHMSVYLYLTKGENDDDLIWPLRYTSTITLLN